MLDGLKRRLSERWAAPTQDLIPPRGGTVRGTALVNNDTAMRNSAVWACLRLRADLISTLPVDVYRRVNGLQVEVPKPPILSMPGGEQVDWLEWMYSSQQDLDRAGNVFGLITATDGAGRPARIELQPLDQVVVRQREGRVAKYKIGGIDYEPPQVWHERQYTTSGVAIGMSPVAYAAWSIGGYLSAQDFLLDWFQDGTVPAAMLKNNEKSIAPAAAREIKDRFKAAVQNRDLFVTGKDWDYSMLQAANAQPQFIESMQYGVTDIARFFGCPADSIDGAVSGSSITYQTIGQKNLQLLIMNLGPAIIRREAALSRLLAAPRYVKLNTKALLRMDPQTQASVIAQQINSRVLAPEEARALDNRLPFTEAQLAEFDRLFGSRQTPPTQTGVPA